MILNNKVNNIIIYLITFVLLLSCNSYYTEKLKQRNIKGIVTDKYIDKFSHEAKTITINGNQSLDLLEWTKGSSNNLDTGNIWDYIEVGDSVYKAEGSLKMKVIKPSGKYQIFDYYYEDGW